MRLSSNCFASGLNGRYLFSIEEKGAIRSFEVNESFAFLLESFSGKDFVEDDVAEALVTKYGIDSARAREDANSVLETWRSCHLLIA